MPVELEGLELILEGLEYDVYPALLSPFVTIRPDDHGFAVFPILGIPPCLFPVHNPGDSEQTSIRRPGNEDIAKVEVSMRQTNPRGIRNMTLNCSGSLLSRGTLAADTNCTKSWNSRAVANGPLC